MPYIHCPLTVVLAHIAALPHGQVPVVSRIRPHAVYPLYDHSSSWRTLLHSLTRRYPLCQPNGNMPYIHCTFTLFLGGPCCTHSQAGTRSVSHTATCRISIAHTHMSWPTVLHSLTGQESDVPTIRPPSVYPLHNHRRRWIYLVSFDGKRFVVWFLSVSHVHPDPRFLRPAELMAWFLSNHFSAESLVIFAFQIFGNAETREAALHYEYILKYNRNQTGRKFYRELKRGIARNPLTIATGKED